MKTDFEKIKYHRNEETGYYRLLGMKIATIEKGHVIVEMTLSAEHMNQDGAVHGGCLYSMCDAASGACASTLGVRSVTSSASIQYLRSTDELNTKLYAEASVLKAGSKVIVNEVTVCSENGTMLAKAAVSQFVVS